MYKEHPCPNCQTATKNPKFCSSSCAAQSNNRTHKKRPKLERFCKKCGVSTGFGSDSPTTCLDCNTNYVDWSKVTLGDLRNRLPTYQVHSRLRSHSRTVYRKANPNYEIKCSKCGYNKYTEIAHLKSVSEFTNDTIVSVINHIDNLAQLCPNCHWEHDHS